GHVGLGWNSRSEPRAWTCSQGAPAQPERGAVPAPAVHLLDPDALYRHIDHLYRAAWALCGSRHDAEDLVQETFLNVLKRPRVLRDGGELGYLLRALRNTYSSRYRTSAHRRRDRSLTADDAAPRHD